MRTIQLRHVLAATLATVAMLATAQVNDKGVFHIGLGWNGGVHATHFENSAQAFGVRVSNSDDDGAVTVSFPLDLRYGLSKAIALGVYIEPGTYLDSNATRSNGYFLAGISGRYYVINKERFAWDLGLDLGAGALRITGTENGTKVTDTYSGGHLRLATGVYFYFGNVFGVNLGLKYAAYNLKWKDRDPSSAGAALDAVDYAATLKTSGVQLQLGLQVRL